MNTEQTNENILRLCLIHGEVTSYLNHLMAVAPKNQLNSISQRHSLWNKQMPYLFLIFAFDSLAERLLK